MSEATALDGEGRLRRLKVTTWNLGYSGLGFDSDFVADGGRRYLPPSQCAVRRNQDAICVWLASQGRRSDVLLLQELAGSGPSTWWLDLGARVRGALLGFTEHHRVDWRTPAPWPLGVAHGDSLFARAASDAFEVWPLPDQGDPHTWPARRRYAALVAELRAGGCVWKVGGLHLSAFDAKARLRRAQLQALLHKAEEAYAAGAYVVLGGDFNLTLAAPEFPHATPTEHLQWVHPFPMELLPQGWRVAYDSRVATVRSNHAPFRAGVNFTAVIDGFILSPNVELLSVEAADLGFGPSDHHPVTAEFLAR